MKTGIYWQDPKYALRPGQDFIFDPSLVLYLPLHKLDGASIMSRDACGHLCSVTGALWTPRGRSFDGADDYISVPDHPSLDITDAITIEAWVKPSNMTGSPYLRSVVSKGDYTSSFILANSYHTEFVVRLDGNTCGAFAFSEWDVWYHIAFTYDKDRGYGVIFLNGVEGTHYDYSSTIGTNTDPFYIGEEQIPSADRCWTGLIDLVSIYNRGLTPLEVQRNYLASKGRYQ